MKNKIPGFGLSAKGETLLFNGRVSDWKFFYPFCILHFAFCILLTSCGNDDQSTPKPRAYFRIDFPEKKYQPYNGQCPFSFDYPDYAFVSRDSADNNQPCWLNLDYPRFHARLHITYAPIEDNLKEHLENSRSLAIEHTLKASAIDEIPVVRDSAKVYGLIYNLEGNTASPYQFYLTDSVNHFFRGALYFSARPNGDSTAPVVNFLKADIEQMIHSFRWRGVSGKR